MTGSPSADPAPVKNVVFIGGSFVAISAVMKMRTAPLPPGYRIVVVEPHNHAHYMFGFPRAAVISGFERELFVPYDNLFATPETGVVVHAKAISITRTEVKLDRAVEGFGDSITFDYMVYCTGARHPSPGNLNDSHTKAEGIAVLKSYQMRIANAKKIVIAGAGAVGLELAAEIKEHYPEKTVTIVHSRDRYMMGYKMGIHSKSYGILKELGVHQILGDRLIIPDSGVEDGVLCTLRTKLGKEIECDLLIPCTGMTPNSDVLATLSPAVINPANNLVRIKQTLQIDDDAYPNIFAGGDVVDSADIKTGLSAFWHADTIVQVNKPFMKPSMWLVFDLTRIGLSRTSSR
ncbi:uncharacterized protein EV422DRAFT_246596 [Fimicolochytrium jonesii]|uniref:uncharacterized protein n=1 Tax=Fimicolochytrium jonesii TaxID=1396493 RepID=UPI0022FDD98A|nr:uncharacterized protein EV422DRAFT_246596 [Fimicolochytrium jonesii]KAI8825124.1 hypothetical protein EV422DRAFT_246596 [Fimicolochytrium jonesii]